MPTLVLGEALVDLVCPRPVASLTDADRFEPHPGGAMANVAVGAARAGARVALAGGAGDDAWGAWLRARLAAEGVDLTWFSLNPDEPTPLAFVTVDEDGEPAYAFYGGSLGAALEALGDRVLEAVERCDGLFFASNTLVGERERELTLAARDRALRLGRAVVFDPNLRLHRWARPQDGVEEARACVRDALLVKCNREEARLLSGEEDPERAADGLLAGGARHVVITLGAEGALLRARGMRLRVPGAPARVVSAVGAGDAFSGVLLARLATSGFYPAAIAAALPEAAATAARATEAWGALA